MSNNAHLVNLSMCDESSSIISYITNKFSSDFNHGYFMQNFSVQNQPHPPACYPNQLLA